MYECRYTAQTYLDLHVVTYGEILYWIALRFGIAWQIDEEESRLRAMTPEQRALYMRERVSRCAPTFVMRHDPVCSRGLS